jgi:hypothetical protein
MKRKEKKLMVTDVLIIHQIYLIRGHKVMLDKDLALLYSVETKVLKQAVKRNMKRFPEDFMFELTEKEFSNLRSQFVTSSWGGSRYLPMAFTEQGVAMLSSVLNNDKAINVNIQIIRVFTKIRQMLADNTELRLEVEKIKMKLDNHGKNMEIVFKYLDELLERESSPKSRRAIGYKTKG